MKISINELRNLVRKAVATQIMESASKKIKTKKTSLAESKKISITELRSMIKEAIIKEAKNSPRELKDRETAIQDTVKELPEAFKNDFQNKTEYTLEQLIEAMLSPTKEASKKIINNVKDVYPSLNFASVQELKRTLKKWILGSEKLETSKQENEDEEPTKRTEPVYQSGETTYEEIAKVLDVTKQAVEKIIKDAEQNFYNIVALLSANKEIKDEEISSDLKTVKKANLRLKLKKSLVDAIAEAAKMVTEKVLDKAEDFIDTFNVEMGQSTTLSSMDYDTLSLEEKTEIFREITKWFAQNGIENPKIEEYSFMIDLLNYDKLEENKKILSQLFFLVDEFKTHGSALARLAKMFHDTIREEISRPFNPETRGRGGIDPIIMQKLKDNDLLNNSEAET